MHRLCGSSIPPTYQSWSGKVTVIFFAPYSSTFHGRGFILKYNILYSETISMGNDTLKKVNKVAINNKCFVHYL